MGWTERWEQYIAPIRKKSHFGSNDVIVSQSNERMT